MRNLIIFTLLVWGTLPAFSQNQTLTLDLSRSIEIASDSSLQAFSTKNLYQSSYWEFRSYQAARLPSLSLSTTPISYNRRFVSRYDSEQNIDVYRSQQSLYTAAGLSLSQNVDFTGGTFYVNSDLDYYRNFGDNVYSQFSSVPVRIGYSQSLFGFNSFKWQRKIEPLKFEKAKRQYLYSREGISETTISYFFNLALAQLSYNLAEANVASSDTLYKIGSERQKIAAIGEADLLTLRLNHLNARNSLKNVEGTLARSMFSFVSFLNLPSDTRVELELPQRPKGFLVSVDDALMLARENNPDYLSYRQQLLEAERNVEQTEKSSNFSASISASIGFNQVADNFRDAYASPLQQDVARINLSIPLIDWGVRKGHANMARNNLNVQKISIQQKTISLEEDITMTVNDFNIQQDLIASAEEAVELAGRAYERTKEQFIIGKADINSLTLSQDRMNVAEQNYISALRNYWSSYYKLRKLTLYDFEKQESLSYEFDKIMNVK